MMASMLTRTPDFEVFVPGVPRPQGSKNAMPQLQKLRRWLDDYRRGVRLSVESLEYAVKTASQVRMIESSRHLKLWRSDVRDAARKRWTSGDGSPRAYLEGPLHLQAVFSMPRPLTHYVASDRTRGLKTSAPTWHVIEPDWDKLARAIGDALTKVVFADDKQIASANVTKPYGSKPGVRIMVSMMER